MSWENPKCTLESLLGVCGKEAAITDDEFVYFMGVRYDGGAPSDMETLIIQQATWLFSLILWRFGKGYTRNGF